MEPDELVQTVRERAEALGVVDVASADSLAVVELALDLEEALGVVLTREDLTGVVTLDELAAVVSGKIRA